MQGGSTRGSAKCVENEYFGKKGIYFLRTRDLKLLSRMKVNDCVFLKLVVSVTGDYFDYLLRARTNLATPLRVGLYHDVIIV